MGAGVSEMRTRTGANPYHESKPLHCSSYYALSKKDQEEMVLLFGRTYGLPVVALRFFNIYGTRQSLSNPYTGVAAIFASRLLNGRAPLVFEDGTTDARLRKRSRHSEGPSAGDGTAASRRNGAERRIR